MDVMNNLFDWQNATLSHLVIGLAIILPVIFYRWLSKQSTSQSAKSPKYARKLSAWESFVYDMNMFGIELNCYVAFVESRVPLTLDLLDRGARVLQKRHPLFRMAIREDSDSSGTFQYFIPMDPPRVDVEEAKTDDWEDLIALETKTPFIPSKGPLWRIRLMKMDGQEKSKGGLYKNIFCATFFHASVDGNCIMRVLNELMDVLSDLSNGDDVDVTSWPLLPALEDFFKIGEFPWWKKIFIKSYSKIEGMLKPKKKHVNPYIECFQSAVSKNPTVVQETRALSIELSADEMQKLRANCRRHGATVHGATTAAAAIAACKILQGGQLSREQTLKTIVMVNMRRYSDPPIDADGSVGLFCAMLPMYMTVPESGDSSDGFWVLAARYTRETREECSDTCQGGRKFLEMVAVVKKILKMTYEELDAEIIADKENASRNECLFLISNLGDCSYFTRAKPRNFELVRKVCACAGSNCEGTFSHYIATVHGMMFWSLAYYTNVCTRDQAQEYADGIERILKMAIK